MRPAAAATEMGAATSTARADVNTSATAATAAEMGAATAAAERTAGYAAGIATGEPAA